MAARAFIKELLKIAAYYEQGKALYEEVEAVADKVKEIKSSWAIKRSDKIMKGVRQKHYSFKDVKNLRGGKEDGKKHAGDGSLSISTPSRQPASTAPAISGATKRPAEVQLRRFPPGLEGSKARRKIDMADAEMTSGDAQDQAGVQNHVTPISRFPYAYEGIPRQYTAVLPFEFRDHGGKTIAAGGVDMLQIRMNSVYDVLKAKGGDSWTTSGGYTADPTPTAASVSGTAEKPYWRDYWMQFYEYWTVLECRYNIKVWNFTDSEDRNLAVFHGYTGIQEPPIYLDPAAGTPAFCTYDDFRRYKGFSHQIVQSQANAWDHNRYHKLRCTKIRGVYHPGDGTHEVVEDELAQTWVRGDAVPKENNNLTLILVTTPGSSSGEVSYRYDIELEYVVQFKDMKVDWQFPRRTVTSNFNKTT